MNTCTRFSHVDSLLELFYVTLLTNPEPLDMVEREGAEAALP
jgi:hypothetical protein